MVSLLGRHLASAVPLKAQALTGGIRVCCGLHTCLLYKTWVSSPAVEEAEPQQARDPYPCRASGRRLSFLCCPLGTSAILSMSGGQKEDTRPLVGCHTQPSLASWSGVENLQHGAVTEPHAGPAHRATWYWLPVATVTDPHNLWPAMGLPLCALLQAGAQWPPLCQCLKLPWRFSTQPSMSGTAASWSTQATGLGSPGCSQGPIQTPPGV